MRNSLPILVQQFRMECRSLAQFIGESWPWTHRADKEAQELWRSIMTDERRWAEQLANIIAERGGEPTMGAYPDEFVNSNLHYLALDYLLDLLAKYVERVIESLRRNSTAVANDPLVHSLFAQMIERKQGHVQALRKLGATLPKATVRTY
jgi:bacterioferritin (cytochrome b1)